MKSGGDALKKTALKKPLELFEKNGYKLYR